MLVGLMCVAVLSVGGVIGLTPAGPVNSLTRVMIGLGCAGISIVTWFWYWRRRLVFRLHVSGSGQIRFAAQRLSDWKAQSQTDTATLPSVAETEVELMPASTIWPWLLLLLLKSNNGEMTTVVILPDSLPADGFRQLAVGCRWIAAHKHPVKF